MLFALVLVAAGARFGPERRRARVEFWAALALLAFLQITASVLNLLPMPGLDGGSIIQPWMSPEYQRAVDLFAPYGFILLFALLWNPRIGGWFFDAVFAVGDALGPAVVALRDRPRPDPLLAG